MAPPATHSQHCSRDNFVHDSTFELHDLPCLEVTDSEVINYDAVRLQVTEWSHDSSKGEEGRISSFSTTGESEEESLPGTSARGDRSLDMRMDE